MRSEMAPRRRSRERSHGQGQRSHGHSQLERHVKHDRRRPERGVEVRPHDGDPAGVLSRVQVDLQRGFIARGHSKTVREANGRVLPIHSRQKGRAEVRHDGRGDAVERVERINDHVHRLVLLGPRGHGEAEEDGVQLGELCLVEIDGQRRVKNNNTFLIRRHGRDPVDDVVGVVQVALQRLRVVGDDHQAVREAIRAVRPVQRRKRRHFFLIRSPVRAERAADARQRVELGDDGEQRRLHVTAPRHAFQLEEHRVLHHGAHRLGRGRRFSSPRSAR
mmetsp:Transcript_26640/g.91931  ORF Transcript_26640/g.91931 Transcript_26640/m.91931 type:complete len:276 (+) Transcript_26640:134-961(+)